MLVWNELERISQFILNSQQRWKVSAELVDRVIRRIYFEDVIKMALNKLPEIEAVDVFLIISSTEFVFHNIKIIDKENTLINNKLDIIYKDYLDLDFG
jgi:hypothetical protein